MEGGARGGGSAETGNEEQLKPTPRAPVDTLDAG
jgi:hypothetical protein